MKICKDCSFYMYFGLDIMITPNYKEGILVILITLIPILVLCPCLTLDRIRSRMRSADTKVRELSICITDLFQCQNVRVWKTRTLSWLSRPTHRDGWRRTMSRRQLSFLCLFRTGRLPVRSGVQGN